MSARPDGLEASTPRHEVNADPAQEGESVGVTTYPDATRNESSGEWKIAPGALERVERMFEEMEERARNKVLWRFFKNVSPEPNTGCWLWAGAGGQYGSFSLDGETMGAHRAAYILAKGPIPDGLCVMHKCDVPGCVNPAHLMVGTHADNTADSKAKGRRLSEPVRALWLAAQDARARIHSDICGHECCRECLRLVAVIAGATS